MDSTAPAPAAIFPKKHPLCRLRLHRWVRLTNTWDSRRTKVKPGLTRVDHYREQVCSRDGCTAKRTVHSYTEYERLA